MYTLNFLVVSSLRDSVFFLFVLFSLAVSNLHMASNIKKKMMNRNRGKKKKKRVEKIKNSVICLC